MGGLTVPIQCACELNTATVHGTNEQRYYLAGIFLHPGQQCRDDIAEYISTDSQNYRG